MAQRLLGYLCSDFSESDVIALRLLVDSLGQRGTWTIEAPRFVDESDDTSCTRPEDEPLRTVGVALSVTSPEELPGTPVDEPTRLLEALATFSAQRSVDFEVQLDDTYVGQIRLGKLDHLLLDGLLARW
jgi:hypothetical protein